MWIFGLALLTGLASASDNTKCGECILVVEPFLSKLTQDLDEDTFKEDMKWICNSMRGDQVEHCRDLRKKFGSDVYTALTSSNGAAQVCTTFDQCRVGDKQQLDYSLTCEDCKHKFRYWSENVNSAVLRRKLEKRLCRGMKDYRRPHCTDIVKQFTPLLTFMMKNLDLGNMLCSGINVCPIESSTVEFQLVGIIESFAAFGSSPDIDCTMCKTMVKTMRFAMMLSGDKIDSSLCTMLPFASQQCEDFFKKYAADIIDAIKKGYSDQQICTMVIHMCGEKGDATMLHLWSIFKNQLVKPSSHLLATSSYRSLNSNTDTGCTTCITMAKAIRQAGDDVDATICDGLAISSQQCQDFLTVHTNQVINAIMTGFSDKEICTMVVRMCSHYSNIVQKSSKSLTCRKCIATVDLMGSVVDLSDSNSVCKSIPIFGTMCSKVMDSYSVDIYDSLKKHLDEETICVEKLKMCKPEDFPNSLPTSTPANPSDTLYF